MSLPVFIGDEVSACGYRLAGLRVRVPDRDELDAVLAAACEEAPLVLLSAGVASWLPGARLEALLARIDPPVVVVPDVRGLAGHDDLVPRMRRQLGVLE
ncbi:MAG: V-type ATP synthase subunit F [Gammaproteobacteria bacterium]